MKVKGKHRELLIELLIYYMNKDKTVKFGDFINEEDPTGRYWITAYIDEYKERLLPYKLHANKMLGIK